MCWGKKNQQTYINKRAKYNRKHKIVIIIIIIYACQIEILETWVCLMLVSNVETVLPLDALQRKMSSTVIMICSVDVRSLSLIG